MDSFAFDWCHINGFVMKSGEKYVHAPFAKEPSPFPRSQYEFAIKLQPIINELVHKLSMDFEFLEFVSSKISKRDNFVKRLLEVLKAAKADPTICLGIHRSDYMLDEDEGIKQVEINTISSSFAVLSSKISHYHAMAYPHRNVVLTNPHLAIVDGFKCALELWSGAYSLPLNEAICIMIVQPDERNLSDQNTLIYELFNRVTLKELSYFELKENRLLSRFHFPHFSDGKEVALAYFRAGYTPNDYTEECQWEARLMLEKSRAIKCPNIAYHLVGMKKIQQILAQPGVVEKYLSAENSVLLRKSFTGLYSLEKDSAAFSLIKSNPSKFVMKPQREGGGNNIYGQDILPYFTAEAEKNGLDEFILMDLINAPTRNSIMFRSDVAVETKSVSELGIFGVWLSNGRNVIINEAAGHLLRTKPSDSNEGGVAAGFSVLDSPALF